MAAVLTDAIILRAFDYGDTSRIVRLLTPDLGVQSAMAKGARRPRSPYSAVLEPFARGTATLYMKQGRDLQTLAGFDLSHRPRALGTDLLRFGGASLCTEIVLKTASEDAHPGLFETFVQAIAATETCPVDMLEATVLASTWSLIASLGFAPDVEACVRCGSGFRADEPTRFEVAAGGLACSSCAGTASANFPAEARNALARFCEGTPTPISRSEGHWRILVRHLGHHVVDGTPLRSLRFLADTVGLPTT